MNVLIIGGSTDIGKNLAMNLLKEGNNVVVTYFHHKDNIPGIEYLKCDVKDETSLIRILDYVNERYQHIDLLISMQAISLDSDFLMKTKEEFMSTLEVNLVGTFLANKVYSKLTDDGMIINIASTDGIDTGSIYNIDYAASKAGVISITKNIANATNNKVICLCPNWIDSDTTRSMDENYLNSELKRIGQSRLITKEEFSNSVLKIITENPQSGDIFRIDIKDDKLWIEKI